MFILSYLKIQSQRTLDTMFFPYQEGFHKQYAKEKAGQKLLCKAAPD